MTMEPDTLANSLGRLVGTWSTEATHPIMPGVVVRGTVVIEWLEGERFLMHHGVTDHPDFPDSLSVIGHMGRDRVGDDSDSTGAAESQLRMHYFDSRGVFRVYDASVDDTAWRWWRDTPGFSQRFTGLFSLDGNTIAGRSQLCRDNVHWADDLQITYRRQN
jgi:hypothetical protein